MENNYMYIEFNDEFSVYEVIRIHGDYFEVISHHDREIDAIRSMEREASQSSYNESQQSGVTSLA